ncbi:hypothetical protein HBB16_21015 [Pseudonocardia sp. MCCB 268]|nr:hypothetical protein [Pseudonocardia cytotoxica]
MAFLRQRRRNSVNFFHRRGIRRQRHARFAQRHRHCFSPLMSTSSPSRRPRT